MEEIMLDVERELKKYKVNTENENIQSDYLAQTVETFSKVFNRVGKEQYKSSGQLEEIITILEEQQLKDENIREIKDKLKISEKNIDSLLEACVMLADSLEDIYRYTLKFGDEGWEKQLKLLWKKVGLELAKNGITRIDSVGTSFNSDLEVVKKTVFSSNIPTMQVTKVIKSGYIYKGNVIRKALVIVNKELKGDKEYE